MQSKKAEFIVELELYDAEKSYPRSLELYEEYSQKNVGETIRIRRENFDKANLKAKRELATDVESEVENFRAWLEETKGLQINTAHYYSISLKSLLLGLPIGVHVAQLFETILKTRIK
ncbi:MAG: hypothetical protein OEY22_11680 [Candidatus Bathyarchaeota archaeon]|nr:hypothetical protein [Candidatus Bathyarchaeota archaeon]MDH5787216.1 hypothetical protein [Candidatus Bathyarchaeota archaeon]